MKDKTKVYDLTVEQFITVIGTVLALVLDEHFYSTMLSSPWSTQKFTQSQEDIDMVNTMLLIASGISLLSAGAISYYLKDKWPLVFTFLLVAFYYVVYQMAIHQKL